MRFDLNLLPAALAIYEAGSVSLAARQLGMSQPAVSTALGKLREVATVPLAVGASFAEFTNVRLVRPPMEIPTFDLKQHWHRKYHKDARSR
jgi:hypothetical protein